MSATPIREEPMAQKILNYKMVTIKSKLNGFTRTVGEPEFNNMIDKSDYEIITSSKSDQNGKPDTGWSMKDIRSYLDDQGIAHTSTHNTKVKLLALM